MPLMNIFIDARTLYWTGIGRYGKGLLDELQELDHENQYTVLMRPADWDHWEPKQPNFTRLATDINPYSFTEQTRLAWLLYRLQPDLVHFLSFNTPLLYFGKHVVTIHDLTLVDHKNLRAGQRSWSYELKYQAMRIGMRIIARTSARIITDAEYTKQELIWRGYAQTSKIAAIPLGAPELPTAKAVIGNRQPHKDQTLLYVGNLYPYKNLGAIIAALPALKRNYPHIKLVIVGQEDVFGAELREQAERLGVAENVTLAGFVSDQELAAHYAAATLYVFPSLSEGFGLPPLEAMAQGLPVAASTASCLPEVLGDAAVYFNPKDPEDIVRVISETLSSPKKLAELKKAGLAHVKTFSWKRMAEQTLAVYKNVLNKYRARA